MPARAGAQKGADRAATEAVRTRRGKQARRRSKPASSTSVRPASEVDGIDSCDGTSARFFLCARCRAQVLVCSSCDRGQIYCADGCAQLARREGLRAAGQRHQRSHRGRLAHAARGRRYRARKKKVTHHGSPPPPPDDLLSVSLAEIAGDPSPGVSPRRTAGHCHWCGRYCSPFVRHGFLRRRRVPRPSANVTEDDDNDHLS